MSDVKKLRKSLDMKGDAQNVIYKHQGPFRGWLQHGGVRRGVHNINKADNQIYTQ